ncbi:ABC transporter permease [Streptomyces sp. NPDC001793]|uniref:ABC transporter permease n=1 Tax=Streptomyces sp. NPDC001793 TaxID=3154657 RepID=UPI0033186BAD
MTADRRRPDHRSDQRNNQWNEQRNDHRSGHRSEHPGDRRTIRAGDLRHVVTHLITPLLMCVGMGLAYLGAFADPAPHHLPVAVVGTGTHAQVLAQTINDKAHGELEARTVPDRATAVGQLKDQEIFGAYLAGGNRAHGANATGRTTASPGGGGPQRGPELLVATAGSDTSATVVQKVFTPLAAQQGAPLKVTDVAPPAAHDPTGQGVFFLLVALSIGSYASVAVIGGAGAVLPMRFRAALAIGTSFVVSILGSLFAGPVFHLVDHGLWGLWGMAWLYSAGILLIGTGLHTFLKRWTTLGVMVLFVMLNFTSAGGVFRPEMQNGFFAALHSFWNGAGFVEGTRSHVYFDGHGLAGHVWTLVVWLLVGLLTTGVAALVEKRRRVVEAKAVANAGAVAAAAVAATMPERAPGQARGLPAERAGTEEEMEEAVGV